MFAGLGGTETCVYIVCFNFPMPISVTGKKYFIEANELEVAYMWQY